MNLARHAWVLCAALAACAVPVAQWEKPGTNSAAVTADSEQCRQHARLTPLPTQPVPAPATSAATSVMPIETESALRETEDFQRCMREKGYSAKR